MTVICMYDFGFNRRFVQLNSHSFDPNRTIHHHPPPSPAARPSEVFYSFLLLLLFYVIDGVVVCASLILWVPSPPPPNFCLGEAFGYSPPGPPSLLGMIPPQTQLFLPPWWIVGCLHLSVPPPATRIPREALR